MDPRLTASWALPRTLRSSAIAAIAALGGLLVVLTASSPPPAAYVGATFADVAPTSVVAGSDRRPVELGMRFFVARTDAAYGLRIYSSRANVGRRTGTLWSGAGHKLATATFADSSDKGWQAAYFDRPVTLLPARPYVISYSAPSGQYTADVGGFDSAHSTDRVIVPVGGGLYTYDMGSFPTFNFRNTNYFVDILVAAKAPSGPPTVVPTTPASSTTPTTALQEPPSTAAASGVPLSLPRIPWEGGPAYWRNFPKAEAAGWADPSFFPVVVWFNGISSDAEVRYDKALGVNTYIGMWEGTPYNLFEDNGVFWIGEGLNNTFPAAGRNWVGRFLDDEVDGRFTPAEGRAHLQRIVDGLPNDGRFRYANFTQMVTSRDMRDYDAEQFVNGYTDVVSVDMYYYTIPYCDWRPYRNVSVVPVSQANCRTASSYGKTMDAVRLRDAAASDRQAVWQFVENLSGSPAEGPAVYITPGRLKGAVMSSIINEARGIVYFNQSFTGSCTGGSIFRQSQVTPHFCGAAQVAAARAVNGQIHRLARIINTQSYRFSLGPQLDTMLKADRNYVYVFSMIDGASQPGTRTFTLPAGVGGREAQVLFENRKIQVSASRQFTDTFAHEYDYHIYRIAR